jgi:hypothetical protein
MRSDQMDVSGAVGVALIWDDGAEIFPEASMAATV